MGNIKKVYQEFIANLVESIENQIADLDCELCEVEKELDRLEAAGEDLFSHPMVDKYEEIMNRLESLNNEVYQLQNLSMYEFKLSMGDL